MKSSIYGLTFDQLTNECTEAGYGAFHARQVWDSLYIDRVKSIDDLPRILHEAFYVAANGRPGPVVVDLP